MSYVDGFVLAVPRTQKETFIAHARRADAVFMEHGALGVRECWGDQVPAGKQTDFHSAVQAKEDEVIVFSWIEWPDKATRDAMEAKMPELMRTDPRLSPEHNPMPFDAKRMIYGGFEPVVSLGG